MPIDYSKRPASSDYGPPGVGLEKVTLTKGAPVVSLTKSGGAHGVLRVNLNWNSRPAASGKGGLWKRLTGAGASIDLDLACLYEFSDGTKGVVQALGNAFQAPYSGPPIIRLDEADPRAVTCAIALLENSGSDLTVRREVRYINGSQAELDAAYGWGMRWTPGHK